MLTWFRSRRNTFAVRISKYFSDYPALAEKIRNREDSYTKDDFINIIEEYNAWKNNCSEGSETASDPESPGEGENLTPAFLPE